MILVKYLYKNFMPVFVAAVSFFSFVLVLVDLFMNLWKFVQNQVPAAQVMSVMLHYVPKTVWYGVPLGILFACSFTLSDFYANNELTAVFASGIPLVKFTLPLLVFSMAMSVALFFFDDRVVVGTFAKKTSMQKALLHEEKSLDSDRIVVMGEGGRIIYKADMYEDSKQRLHNAYFIFRDENMALEAVAHASQARWNKETQKWDLSSTQEYSLRDGTVVKSNALGKERLDRLVEVPETFQNSDVSVEEVSAKVAKQYIEHLRKAGLPYNEALSIYYKKFSFPFVVFIVVFLSIGLSGKTRKNVMLTSLAFSICAAVGFYVTQMVTMLMAKFGYITAFAGAWLPVFLFIAISAVLLKYART